MVPKTNDNDALDELRALLPVNDNGAPRHHEDVSRLLALAGYDPDHIPAPKRVAALQVAWCLEKGCFSDGDIARFVGAKTAYVKGIQRHLVKAGRSAQRGGAMAQALRAAGVATQEFAGSVCRPQTGG